MRDFVRLFAYLRPYTGKLTLAGVLLLLGTPASLFHPLVWLFVVDEVILAEQPRWIEHVGGSRVNLLLAALVVMLLVHVVGTLMGAGRTYRRGIVGQSFVYDLRADV